MKIKLIIGFTIISLLFLICFSFFHIQGQLNEFDKKLLEIKQDIEKLNKNIEDIEYLLSIPEKYRETCEILNKEYGIQYKLIYSLINIESGWTEQAVNINKNNSIDIGLAQLNSKYLEDIKNITNCKNYNEKNAKDNLIIGIKYFLWLYNYWNFNLEKALASYNIGHGIVEKNGVINSEYVDKILFQKSKFYKEINYE